MRIVGAVLSCASSGYADDWEGLSLQAKERIPLQAREMSQAIADSLAAGIRTEDLEKVLAQLQVQPRQQTRNRAESEELMIPTLQAVRAMAWLGATSGEVADTLGRALQNRYTHREMHQLRQLTASPSQPESPVETAIRHAFSVGKSGTTDPSGQSTSKDSRSPGDNGFSGSGGASGSGASSGSSGSSGSGSSSGGNGPGGNNSAGNGHGSQGSR